MKKNEPLLITGMIAAGLGFFFQNSNNLSIPYILGFIISGLVLGYAASWQYNMILLSKLVKTPTQRFMTVISLTIIQFAIVLAIRSFTTH